MVLEFAEEAIWWRGPAPFVFVPVPPDLSAEIKAISAHVTYGWGVIPANVQIGGTEYSTSLFPKDGVYLVPIKVVVQKAEGVKVGDLVELRLEVVSARRQGPLRNRFVPLSRFALVPPAYRPLPRWEEARVGESLRLHGLISFPLSKQHLARGGFRAVPMPPDRTP